MKVTAVALENMGYYNTGRVCDGDEVWAKEVLKDQVTGETTTRFIHWNRKRQVITWKSPRDKSF